MLMTYLMSYVLYLIHLMLGRVMLTCDSGRVMLTCDSFALVGWTSTPKGGFNFISETCIHQSGVLYNQIAS